MAFDCVGQVAALDRNGTCIGTLEMWRFQIGGVKSRFDYICACVRACVCVCVCVCVF